MIKEIFYWTRDKIVDWKVYTFRSASYIGVLNSGMILLLVAEEFNIPIKISGPVIFLLGSVILVVIGWLDIYLGFHKEELKKYQKENPYFVDIITRLERMEKLEKQRVMKKQ